MQCHSETNALRQHAIAAFQQACKELSLAGLCIPLRLESPWIAMFVGEAASTAVEGDIAVADPEASQEESDAAVKAVLSGSVAIVAFQQACKELPSKASIYARFLEVLEPFIFPGTEKVAQVGPSRASDSPKLRSNLQRPFHISGSCKSICSHACVMLQK